MKFWFVQLAMLLGNVACFTGKGANDGCITNGIGKHEANGNASQQH
jgi:hypothetical protein